MAQAVVILWTPDDEARLRDGLQGTHEPEYETQLTPQPRPNVLFEAGMALGRHPTRTLIIEVGRSRPMSDLTGRHVVRLTDSVESRHTISERLRTAGCMVNTQGTDWLTMGDFSPETLGV